MKKSKTENTFKKIEIDEQTAEPVIVDVSEEEILKELEKEQAQGVQKADFFQEHEDPKSASKQLVMKKLGIKRNDENTINKRQKLLKAIIAITFIVFVVGVLAFTFYNDFFVQDRDFPSWKELRTILSLGWVYLLLAVASLFLCYLFKALKLSVICKPLTGKFHFKTCFETGIIGHYYNSVTPLAVGGQPFEIYHLSKHGIHGGVASSLPIATYVLNQFAYVIMALTFLVMFKDNTLNISGKLLSSFPTVFTVLAVIGASLCTLLPLLIIIFSLMPRFGSILVRKVMYLGAKLRIVKDPKATTYKTVKNLIHNSQCLKKIFKKPFSATVCFLLSFLEHFSIASIAYFSLKIFNFNSNMANYNAVLEWLQIVQLVIILNCAISFIPTPGNSGAADLSFYLLFTSGLAGGLAFPARAIWRTLSFYSFIIIGFVFAIIRKRVDKRHEKKLYSDL